MSGILLVVLLAIFFSFDLVSGVILEDAANCFTLNFYKKMAVGKTNVISSPFSADVLLSLLLIGSAGSTADDLTKALDYKDLPVEEMQKDFKDKIDALTSSDGNVLSIADSIWTQENFNLKQSFMDVATQNFQAETKSVDFLNNPTEATLAINNWVKQKTGGLIPKLFDRDLDNDTIMVWVNAIYFKGQWAKKFDESETRTLDFYGENSSNGPSKMPLMNQLQLFNYKYDTTLKSKVLEMEYIGKKFSMIIVLPEKGSQFSDLEDALTCDTFKSGVLSSGSETPVTVTLPRFNETSNFDLKTPLRDMGLGILFTVPDFTKMTNRGLQISKAIQKAVIKVTEEGSEAAASSALVFRPLTCRKRSCGGSIRPKVFRADHPFLYLIRHNPTNLVLFIGRLKDLS